MSVGLKANGDHFSRAISLREYLRDELRVCGGQDSLVGARS